MEKYTYKMLREQLYIGNKNFNGCDLSGLDLSGLNLYNADFTNVDLRNARINWCCLVNVNLSGAILDSTDLNGSNLTGVDVSKCKVYQNVTGRIIADDLIVDAMEYLNICKESQKAKARGFSGFAWKPNKDKIPIIEENLKYFDEINETALHSKEDLEKIKTQNPTIEEKLKHYDDFVKKEGRAPNSSEWDFDKFGSETIISGEMYTTSTHNNPIQRIVKFKRGNHTIKFCLQDNFFTINGRKVLFDNLPILLEYYDLFYNTFYNTEEHKKDNKI
jgi:hypothetical protein